MFTLKVTRFRDGNTASVQASNVSILVDHLKASSARHGFGIESLDELSGYLQRDGNTVGDYEIYYGE